MPVRLRHARPLAMILVCLVVVVPGAMATARATPGPEELPQVAAPFGLGATSLPEDAQAILDLFAALPPELAGQARQPFEELPDRIVAAWGPADPVVGNPLRLTALHFPDGDFFPPDFTAGQYVLLACASAGAELTGCGRDGRIAWIGTDVIAVTVEDEPGTPAASATLHTLAWGAIDAPWLFSAAATSPEALDELVIAFVETNAGSAATPVAATGNSHLAGIIGASQGAVRAGGRDSRCRR